MRYILFVLMLVMTASCQRHLDGEAFGKWIHDMDNGLHVQKRSGDFLFDVQYEPSSYVALKQVISSPGMSYDSALHDTEHLQYYTLTVGLPESTNDFLENQVSSPEEKQQLLYYYSYQFQNDLKLEDGGSKLPCVLFHFERSADIKNSRTFVLAFENLHPDSREVNLSIQSELFPQFITIKISKNNIPSLKV